MYRIRDWVENFESGKGIDPDQEDLFRQQIAEGSNEN